MRAFFALGSIGLLCSCATAPFVATLPPSAEAPIYASRDGNVPAFHAAMTRCSAGDENSQRRLTDLAEREAAERAADGDDVIRVEVVDAGSSSRRRNFESCMAAQGFFAERN